MASANKSILLSRSPQRIPPKKRKRFELLAALWILIYASTALLFVTISIVAGVCAWLLDSAWGALANSGQKDDQQRKS